jgi:hypothetical protein
MMIRRFSLPSAHAFGVAMTEIAMRHFFLAMMHTVKKENFNVPLVIPGKCPTRTIAYT